MTVNEDFRKKNKPVNVKAIFDLVMGLIYVVMGGALAASKYIGFELTFTSPEAVVIFGIAAMLYGAFRMFRGVKLYKQV